MMSPQIDLIASSLCALQAELTAVEKNAENPFFKSAYADLSAIWDAVRPLLAKHGLAVTQTGGWISDLKPVLVTTLMHVSGQWISGDTPLLNKDGTMQSLGSAWSYARRYGLCAILGVTQSDDDGNDASKPVEKKTDFGDYTVTFGKHKHRKLSQMTSLEIQGMLDWVNKQPDPGKNLLEFKTFAIAYLADKEMNPQDIPF